MKRLLFLVLALLLCACGDDGDDGEAVDINAQATNGGVVNLNVGNGNSIETDLDEENESDQLGSPCLLGILWKPVSQKDGKLVILSAVGDILFWSSVAVVRAEDSGIEYCENFGLIEPDKNRQVWRCSLPGEFYTGEVEIEFSNGVCATLISDPAVREDQSGVN